jgi:tetratricopeptide (TPR) repeat protein/S1-C subfamily serine protease
MYRSSLFLSAALMGTTIALVQPMAAAKSASEVQDIAKALVEIRLKESDTVGSGVIIDRVASPAGNRKGDLYTLVTNKHVVCGDRSCSELPSGESYSLGLADGQQYQVKASNIKLLGNDLDLAIIQFRSDRNYAVAKFADPGSLKTEDDVYTAGFPFEQPGFTFGEGKAIAVVNKRLTDDDGGYTIIYNAATLPGMSGGGVFDANGQLVAIHGKGDRFKENTLIDDNSNIGSKIGFNRGISVRWLVQNLADVGINVGTALSISGLRATGSQIPATADEYFVTGFNKYVEPGDNVVAGKQQAIQDFSTAIRLNSRYQYAYFMRAYVYEQIQEFQKSLVDYNQAILINPKYSEAYNNRANLKNEKLNNIEGALLDFNQAISINPRSSLSFNNRGVLKETKLNDSQGAFADYNQSIIVDQKFSLAYNNRALLKYIKLNDIQGAKTDLDQAISINPKFSLAYYNRAILKDNKLNDVQGALSDYNQAISISPESFSAYYNRAILKENKLNDIQGALADYNQAIFINPKYSVAYNNRAILKENKLNDTQGALADYNQAILFNPKHSVAYNNRAILKENKLNDTQGALADFNQAILFNLKYSEAYFNRAILKENKLKDRSGAIQDFRQAARLFREQGNTQNSQLVEIRINMLPFILD